MKFKKWSLVLILTVLILAISGILTILIINRHVRQATVSRILSPDEAAQLEQIDCILVLGCLVHESGRPSDMLRDRLTRGVELYNFQAAPKLLMSGDHGRTDYNEVAAMKNYAIGCGIDPSVIFMDHAGFSTYDSIYRARDIFCADRIIIVTQEYHLYRALYLAQALGIDAWGVASDYHTYAGQSYRDFREILARVKDFALALLKPEPTFLGDPIPVSGDGNLTND